MIRLVQFCLVAINSDGTIALSGDSEGDMMYVGSGEG